MQNFITRGQPLLGEKYVAQKIQEAMRAEEYSGGYEKHIIPKIGQHTQFARTNMNEIFVTLDRIREDMNRCHHTVERLVFWEV